MASVVRWILGSLGFNRKRKREDDAEQHVKEQEPEEVDPYPGSNVLRNWPKRQKRIVAQSQQSFASFEEKMNKKFACEGDLDFMGTQMNMLSDTRHAPELIQPNGQAGMATHRKRKRNLNSRKKKRRESQEKKDRIVDESHSDVLVNGLGSDVEWMFGPAKPPARRRTRSQPYRPRRPYLHEQARVMQEIERHRLMSEEARRRIEKDILKRTKATYFAPEWSPFRVVSVDEYRFYVSKRCKPVQATRKWELKDFLLADQRTEQLAIADDQREKAEQESFMDVQSIEGDKLEQVEEDSQGIFVGPNGEVLSEEDLDVIASVWDDESDPNEVLAESKTTKIYRSQLECLKDGEWLNDEVLNFLLESLNERKPRESPEAEDVPKVWVWNTHFYVKLMDHKGGAESAYKQYTYANVRRWTKRRKVNIFEMDRIVVPVHEGMHWSCAVVDFNSKTFHYYDSLGIRNEPCLTGLASWVRDEAKDKLGQEMSTDDWQFIYHDDVPQQSNSFDCGVFAYMFCYLSALGLPLNFGMRHIGYLRRKMLLDIVTTS